MTVTLKASGVSDVVLCHGSDYAGQAGKFIGPAGDGVSETAWLVQPVQPIRAANRAVYDRRNASHNFSLRVWVEYATEELATSFRLSWAASLPRTAAYLVVVHHGPVTQTYTPAILERCRIEQSGVGCWVDYTFQTGAPVKS